MRAEEVKVTVHEGYLVSWRQNHGLIKAYEGNREAYITIHGRRRVIVKGGQYVFDTPSGGREPKEGEPLVYEVCTDGTTKWGFPPGEEVMGV